MNSFHLTIITVAWETYLSFHVQPAKKEKLRTGSSYTKALFAVCCFTHCNQGLNYRTISYYAFNLKSLCLSLFLSLPLPPLRCKRPWCLFEGLPRHISTANLACYACATIAKSSSFIAMTHKARPKHKCLSVVEPPWMRENVSLYSIWRKKREWIHTDRPPSVYQTAALWVAYEIVEENHFTGCGKCLDAFNHLPSLTSNQAESQCDMCYSPTTSWLQFLRGKKIHLPRSVLPRIPRRWWEFASSLRKN